MNLYRVESLLGEGRVAIRRVVADREDAEHLAAQLARHEGRMTSITPIPAGDVLQLVNDLLDSDAELRKTLKAIARTTRIGEGCLTWETWVDLAQHTARRALHPEYIADGSMVWDDDEARPVPASVLGSMAAMVARAEYEREGSA